MLGPSGGYCTVCLLLILALMPHQWSAAQSNEPISPAQRHFLRAKTLIEQNCIDCNGGNQAGMEEGIREIQATIAGGYSNQVGAYKLLSDAYGAMATYVEKADSKQSEEYWSKKADVQRKLYELDPNDPAIALAYMDTLSKDEEKMPILRGIIERNSVEEVRGSAAYQLGLILIRKGEYREGVNLIADTIQKEPDPEGVNTYASGLMGALNQEGCPLKDQKYWESELSKAFSKAIAGVGDRTAMTAFKGKFFDAVKKHECKEAVEQ